MDGREHGTRGDARLGLSGYSAVALPIQRKARLPFHHALSARGGMAAVVQHLGISPPETCLEIMDNNSEGNLNDYKLWLKN